jgi:hypothetical protein
VRLREIVFLFALCLLSSVPVAAQSPNGTINGLVLDPSGRVIVGADIVIVNDATGVQYSGKTNNEGIYVVTNLPPGPYRLQVSKVGFKTLIKPEITLSVQDALAINFTLPIGAVSETVTVEGGAPLVNTQSAAVSTVIDRNFVENLPLNGRSFNTLLQLTPGVVIAPPAGNNAGYGAPGQFSIAGQRTDANNFTVDGVSANFGVIAIVGSGESGTGTAQAFSALGGTSSLVSVEALQEFRVETSSFAPEFGRAPGGQVIMTTRSGTNDFHGEAYEYFRNDVMDANDWFSDQAGIAKAPERHNDFGGYFGGPILKDKTFFFFSYEGARLRLPQTTDIQVPSNAVRASAPASLAPFLDSYPVPTGPVSASGDTAQFVGSYSNSATLNATSLRVDHTFNGRYSIFGRYNYAPSRLAARPLDGLSINTTPVNTKTLTLGLNVVPNSRIANTLRGNYSTQSAGSAFSVNSFGGAVPLNPSLIFGSGSLNNGQNYGTFFSFDSALIQFGPLVKNKTAQVNVVDDLSVTSGAHQIKFGGDYRRILLDSSGAPYSVSLTTFSFGAFVSSGTVSFLTTNAQRNTQILTQSFSLYGQDTWKITPRLTMTYGLRWELSPPPSPRGSTILAAWDNVNDPAALSLAPAGTPPWGTTHGNVAPRFGIAYSLTGNGDLVFRAGGGVFYDTGVGAAANLTGQFPNHAEGHFFNVAVPVVNVAAYLPVLSLDPPFPENIAGTSPDLILPRSYQWNAALEKSFRGKQAVSLTYVGQAGRDLLRQEGIATPNTDFSGSFLLTRNNARSNYHALQVQYRRPLSNRLQILANYTWSHSLDNASNDVVEAVSNAVISAANDYASSDFDVRQSFSAAFAYNLPAAGGSGPLALATKGWSLDAVVVARTGFPFNGTIGSFSIAGANPRPDLVPGEPIYLYGKQCVAAFESLGVLSTGQRCPGGKGVNPEAFTTPPAGQQGSERRNGIPGFGLTQVDVSLSRRFAITENVHLEFRADAFNALNHPNFANPGAQEIPFAPSEFLSLAMTNQALGGLNPLFQEGGPRSIQLSLKLGF